MAISIDGKKVSWAEFLVLANEAKEVWLSDLPFVSKIPDLPSATHIWLENLPLISEIPNLPSVLVAGLYDLPRIKKLPEMPVVEKINLDNHLELIKNKK